MTEAQFNAQVTRLANRWRNTYGDELARLIWREVHDLSGEWLTRTVDEFIGSCRQPPLMPEFRDAIGRERERTWVIEKQQNKRDSWEFFHSNLGSEERGTILETIRRRLRGQISDEDYSQFLLVLDGVARASHPNLPTAQEMPR